MTGSMLGYLGNFPSWFPNRNTVETSYVVDDCYYMTGTASAVAGFVGTEKKVTGETAAVSESEMAGIIRDKAESGNLPYADTQLEALEKLIATWLTEDDQNAVNAVNDQIGALGTITLESETAVRDTRTAYDALNDVQKLLVTNVDQLTEAENTLQALQEEKAAEEQKEAAAAAAQKKKAEEAAAAVQQKQTAAAKTKLISTIKAKKVTGIKVKAGKKKATVTWKKVSGVALKYKVYYSASKNKGYKLAGTTSSKKIVKNKLKAGKTYYFKVRGYKKIDNKCYYTKYSKIVKVKIKK